MLAEVRAEQRPATAAEQAVLARWSGWGAVPAVFDTSRAEFAAARNELAQLLTPRELAAARRSTLNAHYTDAEIVTAAWDTVRKLGFTAGAVLEPGCGSGNFIGLAPPGAQMTGIEVEPTTAAIAATLYPDATVHAESFATTRAPEGAFDLAIGNVPFGKISLNDARHNPGKHSIHNHFLIKSLHLTRPGGLVVALTSRYTLDAANPAARREMAQLADLVGAVRLPTGAHQRAAGTTVVTDLLVLRRRDPDQPGNGASWETSLPVTLPAPTTARTGTELGAGPGPETDVEPVAMNRYFLDHPEQILGTAQVGRGAYNAAELLVEPTGTLEDVLPAALDRVVAHADTHGLRYRPVTDWGAADGAPRTVALVNGDAANQEGLIVAQPDGTFTVIRDGVHVEHPVAKTQASELRALLGLRDTAVSLLEAEAATIDDTDRITELRAQLNTRYDDYADRFGPIRRCTWRSTGRIDPDTGEERLARIRPKQGGFRADPFSPLVRALEDFDDATGVATKADIFDRRVVAPRTPRLGADSPADALAICLDTHGEVRVGEIARLLGTDPDTALAQLDTLVFLAPPAAGPESRELVEGPARLVPAAEYLSGNVRAKLAVAQAAAEADPRLRGNVDALRPVIPADIGPGEIHVRLGAAWIDAPDITQFLTEILGDTSVRVEHPGGTIWAVRGNHHSVAANSTWGTTRRSAIELAEAALEQRTVRVYDKDDDGKLWLNLTETTAAQEKLTALNERFAEWVWEDPDRCDRLVRTYNDRFNAIALRSYDNTELSLPGIALTFTPRPHQIAAVARMISEPAVGLFHEVGAGKTAEMVIGAMELRRLGMVRKPAIVVPNHMLDQFSREFLEIYPRANILPAGRDELAGERRREFVARAATGDWDAIILTRSAFERLPMHPDQQAAYQRRESERLQAWIEAAQAAGGTSLTIKRMEAILARAEERLAAKLDKATDPGLTFEQTGIDWLGIDEAHDYKNLRTLSAIPDAAVEGSQRASDLDMKLDYLRQRHGGRVGVLATATPIANSVTEAFTMQRFLRPDLLEAAGVGEFDAWAATFGEVVTGVELAPDGGQPRIKSRFAKFKNVPELLRMWHVSADVKTAEDLQLPVPAQTPRPDGQRGPHVVVVPGSPELAELVADLGRRAEQIRNRAVRPDQDNMLKISSEGRAAALDLRLVGASTDAITKLDIAADNIAAIWRRTRDNRYPAPGGGEHPTPGSLQLVFSDLGTPTTRSSSRAGGGDGEVGWDVYRHLRGLLHERGLPAGSVRFIHEARNDVEKAALFQAARTGQIAVLIGSTQRMGVGTNVQLRAIAKHDLDCPWRPADVAQRDGRIIRQGNANPEVTQFRYPTEGSFDAYMWQTVARKAGFIAQIMRGRLDVREIDDIGDAALSFDEVKALATGDPRVLEKSKADSEVARLERLERAHRRNHDHLQRTVQAADALANRLTDELTQVRAAIDTRIDTRGDRFTATIGEYPHHNRADAGHALIAQLRPALQRMDRYSSTSAPVVVAQLGGHPIAATLSGSGDDVRVSLTYPEIPHTELLLDRSTFLDADPVGLIQRLENRLTSLDARADKLVATIENAHTEAAAARAGLDRPFPHTAALDHARATAAAITAEMTAEAHKAEAKPDPTTAAESDAAATATAVVAASPIATHGDQVRVARASVGRRPSDPTVSAIDATGTATRRAGEGSEPAGSAELDTGEPSFDPDELHRLGGHTATTRSAPATPRSSPRTHLG